MNALLILGVSSFLIALILTPLCRNLFRRFGMVDHPDQKRKLHARSIPNMGGIPIAAAYLAGFGALMVFGTKVHAASADASLALKLLAAGGIVLAAGVLDDYFRLQPAQKLIAQIGAAACAFSAGVRITGIAGHQLSLTWSFLATVLWLIACMNAFNL